MTFSHILGLTKLLLSWGVVCASEETVERITANISKLPRFGLILSRVGLLNFIDVFGRMFT